MNVIKWISILGVIGATSLQAEILHSLDNQKIETNDSAKIMLYFPVGEFEDKSINAGKIGKEYSETFRNLGFQIDTKLVMFSHLSSTLSFGWARAFSEGKDYKKYDEWMVSLKF